MLEQTCSEKKKANEHARPARDLARGRVSEGCLDGFGRVGGIFWHLRFERGVFVVFPPFF